MPKTAGSDREHPETLAARDELASFLLAVWPPGLGPENRKPPAAAFGKAAVAGTSHIDFSPRRNGVSALHSQAASGTSVSLSSVAHSDL
jgi:hypothetical protein